MRGAAYSRHLLLSSKVANNTNACLGHVCTLSLGTSHAAVQGHGLLGRTLPSIFKARCFDMLCAHWQKAGKEHQCSANVMIENNWDVHFSLHFAQASSDRLGTCSRRKHCFELSLMKSAGTDGRNCRALQGDAAAVLLVRILEQALPHIIPPLPAHALIQVELLHDTQLSTHFRSILANMPSKKDAARAAGKIQSLQPDSHHSYPTRQSKNKTGQFCGCMDASEAGMGLGELRPYGGAAEGRSCRQGRAISCPTNPLRQSP